MGFPPASRPSVPIARGQLRLTAPVLVVLVLHVVGWSGVWLVSSSGYPAFFGLATLAYALGLRHAFDIDHIAAIDNTTRRLLHDGARPVNVGLFFSLGHSTVVLLMTVAIAAATELVTSRMPALGEAGAAIGTTVSGLFLIVIGLVNVGVLLDVWRAFRATRAGRSSPADLEAELLARGAITRWFGGLFRLITRPWQMYLVGFLFGLGFDTATEIGLLTMAAIATSQQMPLVAVMCLPVVFAAGMSLMDSIDGAVMRRAYGWAFTHPMKKVFYNLSITGLSVTVALGVGIAELVSLSRGASGADVMQAGWAMDSQTLGYTLAGVFVLWWAVSAGAWKLGHFDERR